MSVELEVKDVDLFYGRVQALRGLSIEVNEGEVVSLLGNNGAGKTSTLSMISGCGSFTRSAVPGSSEPSRVNFWPAASMMAPSANLPTRSTP